MLKNDFFSYFLILITCPLETYSALRKCPKMSSAVMLLLNRKSFKCIAMYKPARKFNVHSQCDQIGLLWDPTKRVLSSQTPKHPHPVDSRRRRADANERKRQTGHTRSRRDDEDETPRKTQHDTRTRTNSAESSGIRAQSCDIFAKRLPGGGHMPPLGRIGGPPELMPTKPGSSTPLNRAIVSEESI